MREGPSYFTRDPTTPAIYSTAVWRRFPSRSNAASCRQTVWDFHFVGSNVPRVKLPLGIKPTIHDTLPWAEYAALIRRTDLGLSLMATPHPSYPPLDLAASGAVVVTNKDGPKTSLAHYSANILCVEPSLDALVSALGEGAKLAQAKLSACSELCSQYHREGLERFTSGRLGLRCERVELILCLL